jgi:hypothetical protein
MEYEEIVHRLAKGIDFGKDMENILSTLAREYGILIPTLRV